MKFSMYSLASHLHSLSKFFWLQVLVWICLWKFQKGTKRQGNSMVVLNAPTDSLILEVEPNSSLFTSKEQNVTDVMV